MKRTIGVLICLLLVASFAVSALALGSVQMTLTADKTSVKRGEIVEFTISVPAVAATSGQFILEGYESVFEFVEGRGHLQNIGDVEIEDKDDAIESFSHVGIVSGVLGGNFMYSTESTVSGTIFVFKMKVKDDAKFGAATVAPAVAWRNASGAVEATVNAVEIEIVCDHNWSNWTKADNSTHARNCSICGETETAAHNFTEKLIDDAHLVPGTEAMYYYDCADCEMMGTETFDGSYTPGDLDGINGVTEDDAIYLLMYALTEDAEAFPINQPVDYDKDGDVDEDDAIYLLMYALTEDDEAFPLV